MKTMHLNPYEIQQMRQTMTTREIADHYQIKLNTLYEWCYRNNVSIRRMTDYELEEGIKQYTVKELAFIYHLTNKAIYMRLAKLGLKAKQK